MRASVMTNSGDDAEQKVGQALAGLLSSVIIGDPTTAGRNYLSLIRGGMPINAAALDFLAATPFRFYSGTGTGQAPVSPPEAVAAWKERQAANAKLQAMAKHASGFAALVNAIPALVGDWSTSGRTLAPFYREQWLPFLDLPTAALSPATMAAYDQARRALGYNDAADMAAIAALEKQASALDAQAAQESDVLKQMAYQDAAQKVRDKIQAVTDRPKTIWAAYAKYRNQYQKAVADLNYQMNVDPSDDYKVRTLRDAVSNARDDWQALGNRAQVETALATIARVDGADLSKLVKGLEDRYDAVRQLNDDGGNPFVPVGLVPANFHQTGDSWTRITFDSQSTSDSSSYDHTVTSGGWGPGLFWRGDDASSDTTTRISTNASSKVKVSFEYARVAVDRSSWFDTNLLESTMWKWADGVTSDERLLADGVVPSDPGAKLMLPMYATDVIFARDLTLTVAMSQSESDSFKQTVTTYKRWGFWIFSSSSAETEETTKDSFSWSSGTATIRFPGMQIVGFLCDRLPKLPDPSF